MERLAADLENICNMEGKPRREGRSLGAILTPRSEVVKALNEAKRMKEKEKKKAKEEEFKKKMMKEGGGVVGSVVGEDDEDPEEEEDENDDDIGGVLAGE